MDQTLEKLITWLRNEFILLKRDLANYIIRKMGDLTDAQNEIAKSQRRIADALEKQKVLPLTVTHEVHIPEIKVPAPQVTVNVPEIKLPKFQIPDIKIPPIKLPTINVPKPEVTVNIQEKEDKQELKLLAQIIKKLDTLTGYNLWEDIGVKTPVPVILVDENSNYYKASGGGGVAMIAGGGTAARPMNNVVFGSGRITVTTPGTPVQLPDIQCAEVTITAFENNAKNVSVGGSNVSAAIGSQTGSILSPLGTITLRIDNLKKIFLDAQSASDGITYSYLL